VNLIAYSLACFLTCTKWVFSCIYERLVKHASRIIVALFVMMSNEFMYACHGWDRSLYTCGDLLNMLIHFISYLSSWLHACYLLMVSLLGLTLIFASLDIMVKYSCLNTCSYTLWSTLILISSIASHASLELCLMSSLLKGERICTKLVELFAKRVVERRNMINST
jgi:hypothetical protein